MNMRIIAISTNLNKRKNNGRDKKKLNTMK